MTTFRVGFLKNNMHQDHRNTTVLSENLALDYRHCQNNRTDLTLKDVKDVILIFLAVHTEFVCSFVCPGVYA